jgi:hypothetical protein
MCGGFHTGGKSHPTNLTIYFYLCLPTREKDGNTSTQFPQQSRIRAGSYSRTHIECNNGQDVRMSEVKECAYREEEIEM